MNRKFKIIAIAIAISLLVSSAAYYFQSNNEQSGSVYHVQGILSVYKNGKLIHQGPDLLTNWFYELLPFLLGDVCTPTSTPSTCPSGNWANNVFTFPPTVLDCSLYSSFISAPSSSAPNTGASTGGSPVIEIAVGNGNGASPTDCVLSTVQLYQGANIYVYSPFTNNPNGAPFPCPQPTSGCVQINTTFTATSAITLSEAMLSVFYANYVASGYGTLYTLIAHDTFSSITLNTGDTLTITYTFIFPGIQTNPGSFNENQGAIAALFAQCLGRTYFFVGPSTARLCMDNVLPQAPTSIFVYQPASPCNDMIKPTSWVNRSATISILTSSASKYVKIMAPMFAAGTGTQIVVYNMTINNNVYKILEASQSCQVAQMNNFTRGQSVGIQLNFP